MIHDEFPTVSLHNVAATEPADWAAGGYRLRRAPESVTDRVNVDAREKLRHPVGCELRFVPAGAEPVRVTLSAADETVVRPFWGEFQGFEPVAVGPEPTTLELSVPERIDALAAEAATGAFDPRVCRLRFEPWTAVAVHDVGGDCRPPREDEVPGRRYLAHGTSITSGAVASGAHLSYVSRLARELGVDPLNLGTAGSAFCEPAMAEYLAERDDWEFATLALSVNMANRGFTVEQFAERVDAFVSTVARANPDRPIACVTLFPYHADLVRGDDRDRAAAFRAALREAVADAPGENVHLLEGPDVLPATGLASDLLHPGDAGMEAIGRGLASELEAILE